MSLDEAPTKKCRRCHEVKPKEEFKYCRGRPTTLCKECNRLNTVNWREEQEKM